MKKLLPLIIIFALMLSACSGASSGIVLKGEVEPAGESPRSSGIIAASALPSGEPASVPSHAAGEAVVRYDGAVETENLNNVDNSDGRYMEFAAELSGIDPEGRTCVLELQFFLPAGWYCLSRPYERELYLGATEGRMSGLLDSRLWIYNEQDICVGALGIAASAGVSAEDTGEERFRHMYEEISAGSDYRFAIDEFCFFVPKSTLQYDDRFDSADVNIITQVYYSKEYRESFGYNSKGDVTNTGILSSRPEDAFYVCFEFYGRILDTKTLCDIAKSIAWGGKRLEK